MCVVCVSKAFTILNLSLMKIIPIIYCLSHCSMAVKRHHDQGNSYRIKCLISKLTWIFRVLVPGHHGREHGSRHDPGAAYTLKYTESFVPCSTGYGRERESLGLAMAFEISKFTPSDTPVLNPPPTVYKLGAKHANT